MTRFTSDAAATRFDNNVLEQLEFNGGRIALSSLLMHLRQDYGWYCLPGRVDHQISMLEARGFTMVYSTTKNGRPGPRFVTL